MCLVAERGTWSCELETMGRESLHEFTLSPLLIPFFSHYPSTLCRGFITRCLRSKEHVWREPQMSLIPGFSSPCFSACLSREEALRSSKERVLVGCPGDLSCTLICLVALRWVVELLEFPGTTGSLPSERNYKMLQNILEHQRTISDILVVSLRARETADRHE